MRAQTGTPVAYQEQQAAHCAPKDPRSLRGAMRTLARAGRADETMRRASNSLMLHPSRA